MVWGVKYVHVEAAMGKQFSDEGRTGCRTSRMAARTSARESCSNSPVTVRTTTSEFMCHTRAAVARPPGCDDRTMAASVG